MARTRLRVQEKLVITPTLATNLQEILGDYDAEIYTAEQNVKESYQTRINCLHDAFKFILDTIPLPGRKEKSRESIEKIKKELALYADWCKAESQLADKGAIEEYQMILSGFKDQLINAILQNWRWSEDRSKAHADAMELLNKAEQYLILQRGRPDLATLTLMEMKGKPFLALQWDKQLPPCPKALAEFPAIKNARSILTPRWFRRLPSYQQLFMYVSTTLSLNLLRVEFNDLRLQLDIIRTISPANLARQLEKISAAQEFPGWYKILTVAGQACVRALSHFCHSADSIFSCLSELDVTLVSMATPEQVEMNALTDLRKLPYWYLRMAAHHQRFFKAVLQTLPLAADTPLYFPSRLRDGSPHPANLGESNLLILNVDGSLYKKFSPQFRSSHLASRDVIKEPLEIRQEHSDRGISYFQEIEKTTGKRGLIIGSNISPGLIASTALRIVGKSLPDYEVHLEEGEAVLRKTTAGERVKLLNHPLNSAKNFYSTPPSSVECKDLIYTAEMVLLQMTWASKLAALSKGRTFKELNELCTLVTSTAWSKSKLTLSQETAEAGSKLARLIKEDRRLLNFAGWQKDLVQDWFVLSNNANDSAEVRQFHARLTDLPLAIQDYQDLLNYSNGIGLVYDENGRELVLSSDETRLANDMGWLLVRHCISGKDRTAIIVIHYFAACLFQECYGRWPRCSDTGVERDNFNKFIVLLSSGRHQEQLAGFGASGSDGLKTPRNYWVLDTCEELKSSLGADCLRISDILATNNELRHIHDIRVGMMGKVIGSVTGKPDKPCVKYIIAAQRLTESSRQEFIHIVSKIINSDSYWSGRTGVGDGAIKTIGLRFFQMASTLTLTAPPPAGIGNTKNSLTALAVKKQLDSIKLVAEIYFRLLGRPEESAKRDLLTQKLYSSVNTLYVSDDPEKLFHDVMKNLYAIILDIQNEMNLQYAF